MLETGLHSIHVRWVLRVSFVVEDTDLSQAGIYQFSIGRFGSARSTPLLWTTSLSSTVKYPTRRRVSGVDI